MKEKLLIYLELGRILLKHTRVMFWSEQKSARCDYVLHVSKAVIGAMGNIRKLASNFLRSCKTKAKRGAVLLFYFADSTASLELARQESRNFIRPNKTSCKQVSCMGSGRN